MGHRRPTFRSPLKTLGIYESQYSKVSYIKKRRLRRRIFFLFSRAFPLPCLPLLHRRSGSVVRPLPQGCLPNGLQTPHKRPQTPSNSHKHSQTGRNGRKHPQTPAKTISAAARHRFRLLGTRRRAVVHRTTRNRTCACGNAARAGQIAYAATRTAPGGHRARETAFLREIRAGRAHGRSA